MSERFVITEDAGKFVFIGFQFACRLLDHKFNLDGKGLGNDEEIVKLVEEIADREFSIVPTAAEIRLDASEAEEAEDCDQAVAMLIGFDQDVAECLLCNLESTDVE